MTFFAYDLARLAGFTCAALMGRGQPVASLQLFMESGTLIAPQRIALVERAIESGASHILWLDADMRFPKDTLGHLLSLNREIVGCNYPQRMPPCVFTGRKKRYEILYTWENSTGLEEVHSLGFGCMLTQIEVFKRMETPWFEIPWVPEQKGFTGEDITFCQKATAAGFKVWCDHDLSKVIQHIGVMQYNHLHALDGMELLHGASKATVEAQMTQEAKDGTADADNDVHGASGSDSGHFESK